MTDVFTDRRARFRAFHDAGCFLLPNPWDIGSVRRLEALGFQALATSSAASGWAIGKDDYEITLEDALAHLGVIVGATALPVNADFENGFADTPEGVSANVALAVAIGIAGLSIEDRVGDGLRDEVLAVECVAAAKAACDDALLVARTEAYLVGQPDAELAIRRLQLFAEAGADCLYAPGVTDLGVIRELVAAVAPKPLNVLLYGDLVPADIAATGTRRISVGAGFAWKAWAAFDAAAASFRMSLD